MDLTVHKAPWAPRAAGFGRKAVSSIYIFVGCHTDTGKTAIGRSSPLSVILSAAL